MTDAMKARKKGEDAMATQQAYFVAMYTPDKGEAQEVRIACSVTKERREFGNGKHATFRVFTPDFRMLENRSLDLRFDKHFDGPDDFQNFRHYIEDSCKDFALCE